MAITADAPRGGNGLSKDSIACNLTNTKVIINFVSKEHGLQPSSKFSVIYLGEPAVKKKRYVPTNSEMNEFTSYLPLHR